VVVGALLTAIMPCNGYAQNVPVLPEMVATGYSNTAISIDALSRSFHGGEWREFQQSLQRALVNSVVCKTNEPGSCTDKMSGTDFFNFNNYYVAVFPSSVGAKRVIVRALVQKEAEKYTTILPGISYSDSLHEVFLFSGTYPDSLKPLPDSMGFCPQLESTYDIERLQDPIVTQVSDFLKTVVPTVGNYVGVRTLADTVPMCSRKRLGFVVSRVKIPFNRAEIQINDKLYFDPAKTDSAVGETTYYNYPKTWLRFGALGGYILFDGGDESVKVEDGVIVYDPMENALLMGIMNVYFSPYQAESPETGGPIPGMFIGIPVLPQLGLSLGLSLTWDTPALRSFSLNVGGAYLLVRTTRNDDEIGAEPQDPENPTATGGRYAFFLGIAYSF
jgi:hypothetical protein